MVVGAVVICPAERFVYHQFKESVDFTKASQKPTPLVDLASLHFSPAARVVGAYVDMMSGGIETQIAVGTRRWALGKNTTCCDDE